MSARALRRRATRVSALALVLGLAVTAAAGAAPADTPADVAGWSTTATPNLTVPNGAFADVTCGSDGTCVAVGSTMNASGIPAITVQRRVGGTWRRDPVTQAPTPGGARLVGVSCTTTGSTCVAVGGRGPEAAQTPFAEAWNGARWVPEAVPGAAGHRYSWFSSVSCVTGAFCVAAGQSVDAADGVPTPFAAVRRDGAWTVLPTPPGTGGRLEAVSCSSVTSCHVGGWTNAVRPAPRQTLVDVWDGTAWSALPQVAGQLLTLWCPTADRCTGGGYDVGSRTTRSAIAVVVDGATTTRVAVPTPQRRQYAALMSVWCSGPLTCLAIGFDRVSNVLPFSLTTADGGLTWTAGKAPPRTYARLSCTTVDDCTAVGVDAFAHRSSAAHLAGRVWTLQTTADPPGVVSDELASVSCRASTACLAVGGDRAHLVRWDGTTWSTLAPPAGTTVDDVSCATTTVCLAVGQRAGVGVSALWSAGVWTVTPIEGLPTGVGSVYPVHVSCASRTRCALTAYFGLVGAWDGRSWTLATTPEDIELQGVSCSSRTRCVAVGLRSRNGDGRYDDPVAVQFDGTSWTTVTLPAPATATQDVALDGVSCSADGVCTAVGSSTERSGVQHPLVEVGTVATGWTVAPTPAPTDGPVPVRLGAVSCPTSTVCTAVGTIGDVYDDPAGTIVLRSAADGWHSQESPAASVGGRLEAVSCPDLGWCAAVGSQQPRREGSRLTFAMVWHGDVA